MLAPYDKVDYSPLITFAFEALTVSTVAVGLTAAVYDPAGGGGPAKVASMRFETGQLRYTDDGVTVPTNAIGTLLEIGETLVVYGSQNIKSFRAIQVTTGGKLDVHYGR